MKISVFFSPNSFIQATNEARTFCESQSIVSLRLDKGNDYILNATINTQLQFCCIKPQKQHPFLYILY